MAFLFMKGDVRYAWLENFTRLGGLKPLNPSRKCVVIFSGFGDTVINYVECENGLLTVSRLVENPNKVCRSFGKGNYKLVALKLKQDQEYLTRGKFLQKVEECIEKLVE